MVAQQPARMEIIQDLKGMLITLLNSCRTGIKAVPMQVVFYRDGVSEGQFNEVMAHEVKAINEAYAHYNSALKPKITFVIVAKRHHTRLFPANNEAAERTGNCLPGTVVDTTIVHPHRFDFYLQSHSGLQGTAKPLLYTVLRDDIGFTPDDLQSVSFSLCHMYSIATKSVSLVTPAYFAHRVAFRARSHTSESWSFDASDTASSISGSDSSHPFTHESKLLPVHPNLRHHMYFM
ncbi:Protein argonaute 18 [Zancudomyces culisetae]|uniref:Protein argonaute 18 n=1 Tax=Zancudomyces culisetae TaxID=1213189 RepID=A0A1R1PJZ9_ZANCU|nr:Protein argonaute 18 [Zancudomyces culisetae]OMH81259.1 Protein argonaute 18 [Zancudomyces culisetae]|eukprot:OMH79774.1 Protein argonaute 18 [Zancudomyces culisetae]